jgi:hypothetical protein
MICNTFLYAYYYNVCCWYLNVAPQAVVLILFVAENCKLSCIVGMTTIGKTWTKKGKAVPVPGSEGP